VYLHYVLDLWADWWRKRHAHGDVVIVRFADDFIIGFEHKDDADRFLDELRGRFAEFGLELHPGKTRLIEFGRHAARHRIADERVLRLVGKWLAAGVIEDGEWTESEKGSPQGSLCSANITRLMSSAGL